MRFQDYINKNNDTFFDLSHIGNEVSFMKDCISKSYKVKVDELDCYNSIRRQPTKKTIKDVLEISKKDSNAFYTFVLRILTFRNEDPYIEAGIRTNSKEDGNDYFLWIHIKPEKLEYFIKKYRLKRK